jgi:phage tail sheath protein FI
LDTTAKTITPLSGAVAGLALRRQRIEGFRQPPAGREYPLYGISEIVQNVKDAHQAVLNPRSINVARNLPNSGNVIWGARSLNTDGYFRWVSTRVILNVLEGTLRNAFGNLIFTTVDGQGVAFQRIKTTAVAKCELLRLGGALYGATPNDAYLVVCDETNNPADSLQEGIVVCDVYVKVSPVLEFLVMRVKSTALGEILTDFINASVANANTLPNAGGFN